VVIVELYILTMSTFICLRLRLAFYLINAPVNTVQSREVNLFGRPRHVWQCEKKLFYRLCSCICHCQHTIHQCHSDKLQNWYPLEQCLADALIRLNCGHFSRVVMEKNCSRCPTFLGVKINTRNALAVGLKPIPLLVVYSVPQIPWLVLWEGN